MQKLKTGAKQKAKPRNWPAYDLYRKDEEALFLEKAKLVVWSMDAPWEPKSGGENGGRTPYPPRAMVMCALLKEKFRFDYRSMESHLRARPDLLKIMEIDRAPSKSVIHDAAKKIPEKYLKRVNSMLVEPLESKKGI
ncbi:MAG: transposase [Nitrososphaerales archaeon]